MRAARSTSLLTIRDLEASGLSRVAVGRRVARGQLVRVQRGVYAEPSASRSEHHDLAIVAARSPRVVVCLLSAAAFHRLGTQAPHELWVALPPRTWAPTAGEGAALRVVRFTGPRYGDGVEEHRIAGVTVRVYSVAKTVVDLFRYRNKVGLDVALEALRESRRDRRCSLAELTRLAQRSRVLGAMRPYLESVG
jgi:predicted transcriptional regulator of viral defense system